MRPTAIVLAVASTALLAACASSGTAGGSSGSGSPAAAAPSSSAASPPAASQSAPATSLDPCQLVTSSEASSLAGASFGAGKEETSSGGGKQCVYGYQTTNVFMIEVGQAPDSATAQRDWTREEAKARALIKRKLPAGVTLSVQTSRVSGLADRADTIYGSTTIAGQTIGFSGIYLLKGATVLAFQDLLLGHAPPSTAAMRGEAQTALSRVS